MGADVFRSLIKEGHEVVARDPMRRLKIDFLALDTSGGKLYNILCV